MSPRPTGTVPLEATIGRPRVRVCDLTVSYGSFRALSDVTLDIHAGTAVALIGPNGSGKTTLLHAVAGLVTPSSGTVEVEGGGQGVAYVLQRRSAHSWMPLTVTEVMAMGRYRRLGLLRRPRAADRRAVADAAERLEVTDLLGRQFGELSGGQRQRVLVAQALALEPTVLLLDEPITGLDLPSQQRILDILDAESERGVTVLLATHHLDEARHCDRVLVFANHITDDGPPEEVLTPERLAVAYRGRVLGPHAGHDHAHDLIVFDEHGH